MAKIEGIGSGPGANEDNDDIHETLSDIVDVHDESDSHQPVVPIEEMNVENSTSSGQDKHLVHHSCRCHSSQFRLPSRKDVHNILVITT